MGGSTDIPPPLRLNGHGTATWAPSDREVLDVVLAPDPDWTNGFYRSTVGAGARPEASS
jgi:hypothetical protein